MVKGTDGISKFSRICSLVTSTNLSVLTNIPENLNLDGGKNGNKQTADRNPES
jgi:hypothetical protein